jgi:hypothetical protein
MCPHVSFEVSVSANSFKHFSKGQIKIFFSSLGRLIFSSYGIKLLLEC